MTGHEPLDGDLTASRIADAVEQFGLKPLLDGVAEKFSEYYTLLRKWNSKLNLTAIRDPEEVLQRHFVECIFCAQHIPEGVATLLDYGSGAGFPGIPIALCRSEVRVTLAESQGKKASFLREAVRSLDIRAEVYGARVEEMSTARFFDAVTLRAVDKMQEAVDSAASRAKYAGYLALLATAGSVSLPRGFLGREMALPTSKDGVLLLASRSDVPRETILES